MKRFWNDLKSHYKYSIQSAKSSLKSEIANSYLNWIWWVLEPFCFMLIYAFIFGVVFDAREPHFPLFIFLGLTLWDFFNRCIVQSVKIMRNNKAIVTKVYLPKFILLITRMFLNGYKMLFSWVVIVIMIIYFRIHLTWRVIFLIPELVLLFTFTFALMTHLLHYGVFLKDLENVTSIVLRMLYFLTGIFFNIEKRLPKQYVPILMKCNPLAIITTGTRKCILYGESPDLKVICVWIVISLIIAAFGVRKIYRNENSYVKLI
ncbi:MAG: ABC transporter permease [Eubacterium sp.]|nr:ABC transporter permease [Eubacterium sp.]